MSGKQVVMAKRKQKIKVVLHTPTEMDAEKNPNEYERNYLKEQIKKKLIDK